MVSTARTVSPGGPVRIRMFGTLRVESEAAQLVIPSGRARSLFCFLVLARHPLAREAITETLWPGAEPERGGRALSDSLYRLRRALGPGWITSAGDTVGLVDRLHVSVDAWEFEEKTADGGRDALRNAIGLYTGELLPDLYDDWLIPWRESLAERYRQALRVLGADAERGDDLPRAFQYYRWLSYAEPLDESAHQGLMRVYMRGGHGSAALQQYERLVRHLATELGVEPLPETRALAEVARREGSLVEHAPRRQLVGRRPELRAVLGRLDAAWSGEPDLVLVEGEPGIGKTRLLEAIAESAAWRGWAVAWGRGQQLGAVDPYAPLEQALAMALPRARRERLRDRLTPAAAEALVRILPGARRSTADRSLAPSDLAGSLATVARESSALQPQLWIFDDVHWAADGFWGTVGFLEHLAPPARMLVILAYRRDESEANETAWGRLLQLDRDVAPLRLSLGGLSVEECRELARELDMDADETRVAQARRMTGGNPLLLQETLAAADPAVPTSFAALLDERLAPLVPEALAALDAAAVLGQRFAHGTWLAVAGEQTLAQLPVLLERRFIVEEHDGYTFQHELVRQGIYRQIPAERLRSLQNAAAEALEREGATPATLAWHFTQAGRWSDAIRYHRRAGERSVASYAYTAALAHADEGLALLREAPDETSEQMRLLSLRQRVLGQLLRLDAWRAALDETERLATAVSDDGALLEVLEGRVKLDALDGRVDRMRLSAERALELARRGRQVRAEARVLTALGWHVSESLGANDEAVRLLGSAVDLARETGDADLELTASCRLSAALRRSGRCHAAHDVAARAIALVETRPDLHAAKAFALEELAAVAMELGRWEEAREAMHVALESYRDLRDPWAYGAALFDAAIMASSVGEHAEAIAASEQVVRIGRDAGVLPGSDYGAWHLAGLARAHLLAGDLGAAGRIMEQMTIDGIRSPRSRLGALTVLGELHLARGEPALALDPLRMAATIWREHRQTNDVPAALHLAIAAARSHDPGTARKSLRQATRVLDRADTVRHSILLAAATFEVTRSTAALDEAHLEVQRQAALFTSERLRTGFLEQVALNRHIEEEWAGHGMPGKLPVHLARADAPLGRALRQDERVDVQWTVDAGAADEAHGRRHGSAELRRHRLKRLLDEADRSGAAPTDTDLADALDVSRRTVLRDLALLAKQGRALPTRRRLSHSPPVEPA